jgi:transposase
VHRFNEQSPDGLTNKEGAGRPRLITDEQMQELARIVEAGPDPQIDGVNENALRNAMELL